MKKTDYIAQLITRYPVLEPVKESIEEAVRAIEECYDNGGKLLIAGNGGSCADADHMVGELMKGFVKKRNVPKEFEEALVHADEKNGRTIADKLQGALPAISLCSHPGLSTAFLNDVDGDYIYAQQLFGYGEAGDVFIGISTSGNAKNIMYAAAVAHAKGIKVIGLTGKDGGAMGKYADTVIIVPEQETYKIQELHLPIYHAICLALEEHYF